MSVSPMSTTNQIITLLNIFDHHDFGKLPFETHEFEYWLKTTTSKDFIQFLHDYITPIIQRSVGSQFLKRILKNQFRKLRRYSFFATAFDKFMDWKRFDLAEAILAHTNVCIEWIIYVCHTDNVDALEWMETFSSRTNDSDCCISPLSDLCLTFSDVNGPNVFCWMLRKNYIIVSSGIFGQICKKACEFKTYQAIKCALNELPPRYISDEFRHYQRKFDSAFCSIKLPTDLINLFKQYV